MSSSLLLGGFEIFALLFVVVPLIVGAVLWRYFVVKKKKQIHHE